MTFSTTSCEHCGLLHNGTCPRIKRITYYENGMRREIEYWPTTPSTPSASEPLADFLKWWDKEIAPLMHKRSDPLR